MILTFDSNDATLVSHVVDTCPVTSVRWCVDDCRCSEPSIHADGTTLLYDTPIALCEAKKLQKTGIDRHFIYLDHGMRNNSYKRIVENLKHLGSDRCTIIQNSRYTTERPSYLINSTNLSSRVLADAIASVINSFINTGQLQHPNDLATKNYGRTRITNIMQLNAVGKERSCQIDCERRAC